MILAGDIGGTNARLALFEDGAKKPVRQARFESRKYKSLEAVLGEFLAPRDVKRVKAATFGVAGPVIDQKCVATNFPWVVDARVIARKVGLAKVTLLNDLVALAFGALTVPKSKLRVIQGARPKKTGGNIAVIAAGTGLGEAALIWDGEKHVPLATEGGHTDFAARTLLEWELADWLEKKYGHVSYERIVAGPGISHLYDFFADVKKVRDSKANTELLAESADRNAAITTLGMARTSEPASLAIDLFAQVYGAEAGNLALKTLATGGVYVAGAIAGHVVAAIERGGFLEAFLDKGRFRGLLEKMGVAVVLDTDIGLAGSRYHAGVRA
jgi:glucokinase